MKLLLPFLLTSSLFAEEDRINLSDSAIENLGIEVAESSETTFEETFFSIGHLSAIPSNHSVISTRVPGRVIDLKVIAGDFVKEGDPVVTIESRQAGNPPPSITLKAPATGIVAESHVRLGEPVDPSKELLDILDLRQLWATARVPQQEAAQLKIGTQARIKIPALGEKSLTGKLIRFGTVADASAGTFDAIFLIENPDLTLRPEMRAEFSIITSTRENVTVIPKEAVQGDLANRVVYIRDFELPNSFIKSPVVTGASNDHFIEIESGLFPGDEVVTNGAYLLGFAGTGNLSLKEILDAAHGHEHNEDGSEITEEQHASTEDDHHHSDSSHVNRFLLFTTIALGLLLVLAGLKIQSLASQKDRRSPKGNTP